MGKYTVCLAIVAIGLTGLSGCAGSGDKMKYALGKDIAAQRGAGAEGVCPSITRFVVSPLATQCGGEVSLEISAVAPAGADISYSWEIEGQSFDTGERAVWKTPTCATIGQPERAYTVRGVVSDGQCSVTQSVEVNVTCICAMDLMVNFAFAKANLDQSARAELDAFAQKVSATPNYAILIEGHTDAIGKSSSNKRLGMRRADAVKNYLVTQWKIDPGRFITRSFGEDAPIAPNDTAEGRAKNRRAEIFRVVLKTRE